MKLGAKVKWTSQSAGSWRTKTGKVVQVVPAYQLPHVGHEDYGLKGIGASRDHESYVVEVDLGERRKPRRYWPRVSNLSLARA